MRGKCPARHVKTYIHPAPLGLTDIVKIDKRFEDAPIGEITERKLAQGVRLHLTYIHVPPSVPSQFLAKRHL